MIDYYNHVFFRAFLDTKANRLAVLKEWADSLGVKSQAVSLAGKTHLFVKFQNEAYDPTFKMRTLIAHYDRALNTPGANDNSAACAMLMFFIERLLLKSRHYSAFRAHNIRIIFTDGEEAAKDSGIIGQGAYALGEGLRKLSLTDDDIYVFDACGRGDTLIVSTSGLDQRMPEAIAKKLHNLHTRTADLACEASPNAWLKLYTPFSDNAGLLAQGLVSQVITVLPSQEARTLLLAPAKIKGAGTLNEALIGSKKKDSFKVWEQYTPETWKRMHTEKDTLESLNQEAFALIGHFLDLLANKREVLL